MKILLFIGSLERGGAQRQMAALARGLAALGHRVWLVSIEPCVEHRQYLEGIEGLVLRSLAPRAAASRPGRAMQLVRAVGQLRRVLGECQPEVIFSSLYVSNVIAYGAWWPRRRVPLIWSLRGSSVRLSTPRKITVALSRRFVPGVAAVLYNSVAGRDWHVQRGFPKHSAFVVPNGIDSERFQAHGEAGQRLRGRWQVTPEQILIGLVGRLAPMKDHSSFLRAAARVVVENSSCRFVCVGEGTAERQRALEAEALALGLGESLLWVGHEGEMQGVYSAMDVLVSSSAHGEGFSNVLGEAMACGVPCVATDVGDARHILGETGVVVPPRDSQALAQGILKILREGEVGRRQRGQRARRRIEEKFSVTNMVNSTAALLRTVVEGGSESSAALPRQG